MGYICARCGTASGTGRISSDYFSQAVLLSPTSARLYDEWAVLLLSVLGDPGEAKLRLDQALEIDPYYDWTYALLGDYYTQEVAGKLTDQPEARLEALQTAANLYTQALERGQGIAGAESLFNYALARGGAFTQLKDAQQAIESYELALSIQPETPDTWRLQLTLVQLYYSIGDTQRAAQYALAAQQTAPADQQEAITNLLAQLGVVP